MKLYQAVAELNEAEVHTLLIAANSVEDVEKFLIKDYEADENYYEITELDKRIQFNGSEVELIFESMEAPL